ncbi:hypothetical protein HAX54_000351 [Datura stramonium]|uniref:TFIIS N-terminal domain-containing protein n=1 Tax=Datura stramonium TaxID=4076 RepID=A0ABS8T0Y2_DATST|nr:hypothetical protein [Datura stramonium]
MSYDDNMYRDEEEEPLIDFNEDVQSNQEQHENLLDNLDDDDAWNQRQRERSPTPVYNEFDQKLKPRKRLIKKLSVRESTPGFRIEDDDAYGGSTDDDMTRIVRDESDGGGPSSLEAVGRGRYDREGGKTVDDDNFIDDSGLDPADRYISDNEPRSPSNTPQVKAGEGEDDEEIKQPFMGGKKRKKIEKSAAEIALLVENVMAELEVAAEEDAVLNSRSKPAINKLKKPPQLIEVLSKKQLQQEFLDHGVLTLLKNWLEPLPDGSLPNINIRAAILKILTDYPIGLEQYDRREQLRKSGLGKASFIVHRNDHVTIILMPQGRRFIDYCFYARSYTDIVGSFPPWNKNNSRPIFNKSTRFEDMRNHEDETTAQYRWPSIKKGQKSSQSSSRQLTTRPEAMSMDFVVRPQSKIDPEEIRARAKAMVLDQR